ncbi:DUF4255 domain-containing protein [Oculatella sp. LEGE 06141]|uniref:DUF4255 domain-containing protein n=1 Tax=Oculatella sp. LEGE 06141 TaxID=1828648 RepID=UPI00187E4B41|nr:DUF4255 domain-containing protein [Oculatella sp. LEGE 06141]MBE9182075.1 DUF4255 domain-containing protein [Oculatella sp. LEGE 06141]
MSNALVIAAVTAVLKDILENGLANDAIATSMGDTLVTAIPPDRISVGSDERPQLNLFLYQVSQNRNADWIGRDRPESHRASALSSQPPLALDLHYLLTAYGAKDFQAELLLGYAMQLLHDLPVIGQEMFVNALQRAAAVSSFGVLSQALTTVSIPDLVKGVGSIKLNTEFFNMEETSKLWSALQTHYRPSAAYRASMVLIESRQPGHTTPTLEAALPQPLIEKVTTPTGEPITAGSMILLQGERLQSDITQLRMVGRSALLKPKEVQPQTISVILPSDLLAGVHGIQVVHQTLGQSLSPLSALESNVASFVVHPLITASVDQAQPDSEDLYAATIIVNVRPRVGKSQRVFLLLSCVSTHPARIYPFAVQPHDADADILHIPVTALPAGTYWVQLQVDGAQSPLHPAVTGEPGSPQVELK